MGSNIKSISLNRENAVLNRYFDFYHIKIVENLLTIELQNSLIFDIWRVKYFIEKLSKTYTQVEATSLLFGQNMWVIMLAFSIEIEMRQKLMLERLRYNCVTVNEHLTDSSHHST